MPPTAAVSDGGFARRFRNRGFEMGICAQDSWKIYTYGGPGAYIPAVRVIWSWAGGVPGSATPGRRAFARGSAIWLEKNSGTRIFFQTKIDDSTPVMVSVIFFAAPAIPGYTHAHTSAHPYETKKRLGFVRSVMATLFYSGIGMHKEDAAGASSFSFMPR